MTSEIEIKLMNRFKESYQDFPNGNLISRDIHDIDFILTKLDGSTIGIELTEALHSKEARQTSNETYNFTNQVLEKLKNHLQFSFAIDIDLNINEPISKSDRPKIIDKVVELNGGFRNLPPGIQRIKIYRVDGVESWNWRSEGGIVPNFTIENLTPILERKHKKLNKYSSCSQYWLIITEGNYYTGSFKKILISSPIESELDKVFLFREVEDMVIELK